MTHGGARVGAGRRSVFRGIEAKPFAMDFTPAGRKQLDRLCKRTKLSRNDVLAHLTAEYAADLQFTEAGVVYPGKAQEVLAIRMPTMQADVLRAARERTGKSYSDIGEALVCQFGRVATFPRLRAATPRKRTREARS